MDNLFGQDVPTQLENLYTTKDVAAQRDATLRVLQPQPGERILDVGSGPGLLALQIADLVAPTGSVTGIDVSADMVRLAQSRQHQATSQECLVFRDGDATSLPFADAAFDAAVSTQVYEYVNNLTQALDELYRVLRPGGRVVIVDTDWDSLIWHVDDLSLLKRITDTWKSRFAEPCLPRTLRHQLANAGFINQEVESLVILNLNYDDDTYSVRHLPIMVNFLTRHGVSESDVRTWLEDLHRQGQHGTYFFSLNRYIFLATKP